MASAPQYCLIQVCNRYARANLWVSPFYAQEHDIDEWVVTLRQPILLDWNYLYFVKFEIHARTAAIQAAGTNGWLMFTPDEVVEIRRPDKRDFEYMRTYASGTRLKFSR